MYSLSRAGLLFLFCWLAVHVPCSAATADLPLKRVVLFNNSVAYFEHAGEIDGDQSIELRFPSSHMNDLLKSLVVLDTSGKHRISVNYEAIDPAERTLSTMAVDLSMQPTVSDLLRQLRGQSIRITADAQFEGRLLGVERRSLPLGDNIAEVDMVNVVTTTGLRSIPLHSIIQWQLLDEDLQAELQQALTVLADAQQDQYRSVQVHFSGEGKRQVRLGYLREFPLWRTSYRLVLNNDDTALLQGWAHVENVTDESWEGVQLTLVSGQPISFVMNLYQPVYVQRPFVQPDYLRAMRSVQHGSDLGFDSDPFEDAGIAGGGGAMMGGFGGGMGGFGGGGMGGGVPGSSRRPFVTSVIPLTDDGGPLAADFQGLQDLVPSATGVEAGELFRYEIADSVTLPTRQSAMLPIVNQVVPAERLSIYNPTIHRTHPLHALRIINASDVHWMAGPIAVFDAGEFAGDAQIADTAPAARRLISYALDADVDVADGGEGETHHFVTAKLAKGMMHITKEHLRSHTYRLKNADSKPRRLLLEQAIADEWKLLAPEKPDEMTHGLYRFQQDIAAGKSAPFVVKERRQTAEELAIGSLSPVHIDMFVQAERIPEDVRAALVELTRQRAEVLRLAEIVTTLRQQLNDIDQQQSRIRQNMHQLDRNTELYQRYVQKLSEQEQEVETIQAGIVDGLRNQQAAQRTLDDFIGSLETGASGRAATR